MIFSAKEFSKIFLEHTLDSTPQPGVYVWEFLNHLGVKGDSWDMLQGYVGVLLDFLYKKWSTSLVKLAHDLTRRISPQKVVVKSKGNGTSAISGNSRLVKYYSIWARTSGVINGY